MEPLLTHGVNGEEAFIPSNAKTLAVSFAGYNREILADDLVYVAINSHWEDVRITLPALEGNLRWYLSVNTWGEKEEVRIDHEFIMRPRSVAVFTGREL